MQRNGKLVFAVTWEVRAGLEQKAAEIVARFAHQAREEPGLELLMVNRSTANPAHFLFYEVFADAASFEAHQQTPHFRKLILEEALPCLAKRERVQYEAL